MTRSERIHLFAGEIWSWYERHKRQLPWRDLEMRDDTERAYRILVSEMMLQQTQVSRVLVLYPRFLGTFPAIRDLAEASNAEVIHAWRGMGYNMRALRLRDAAREIVKKYNGKFPHDFDSLLSIKGIGEYTAGAIRNFAFNLPTACVDVNIERIYLRVFYPPKISSVSKKEWMKLAEEILVVAIDGKKNHTAKEWHAALMDFGSMVCKKKSPRYDTCPLMARNLYQSPQRVTGKKKTIEKGRNGVPNRIYRGRIVELLRDRKKATLGHIREQICVPFPLPMDDVWLDSLLKKLAADELITVRKDVVTLTR